MVALTRIDKFVPISQFNKGKASQIFAQMEKARRMIVMKNNQPAAVILSMDEYERLRGQRNRALKLNKDTAGPAMKWMQEQWAGVAEASGITSDEDVVEIIREMRYGWRDKCEDCPTINQDTPCPRKK